MELIGDLTSKKLLKEFISYMDIKLKENSLKGLWKNTELYSYYLQIDRDSKNIESLIKAKYVFSERESAMKLSDCNYSAKYSANCIRISILSAEKKKLFKRYIKFLNKCGFDNIGEDLDRDLIYHVPKVEWQVYKGKCQYFKSNVVESLLNLSLLSWGFIRAAIGVHYEDTNFMQTILEVADNTRLKAFKALIIGYMKTEYFWDNRACTSWMPCGKNVEFINFPIIFDIDYINKVVQTVKKLYEDPKYKGQIPRLYNIHIFSSLALKEEIEKGEYNPGKPSYARRSAMSHIIQDISKGLKVIEMVKKLLNEKKYLKLIGALNDKNLPYKIIDNIPLKVYDKETKEEKVFNNYVNSSQVLGDIIGRDVRIDNKLIILDSKYEYVTEKYISGK